MPLGAQELATIVQALQSRNPGTSQGGNNLIANMIAASQARPPVAAFGQSVPGQGEPTNGYGAIPPMFSGGDKGFAVRPQGQFDVNIPSVGGGGGGGGGGDIQGAIMRALSGATSRVDPYNPKGMGSGLRPDESITGQDVVPPIGTDREWQQAQEGRQTSNSPVPPNVFGDYLRAAVLRQLGKLPLVGNSVPQMNGPATPVPVGGGGGFSPDQLKQAVLMRMAGR